MAMTEQEKLRIIEKAKGFFKDEIASNHVKNTTKLSKLKEFNYNPFLIEYLAQFSLGKSDPIGLARVLVSTRSLGSSITTSFGTQMQKFCSKVLSGYGSVVPGIDLEFTDQIDGRKKYCQLKVGPDTINKDDVKTISDHFQAIKNLARTNNLDVRPTDMIVGVMYGTDAQLSTNYRNVNKQYPVYAGADFWIRLTGDKHFYQGLIDAFGEVAEEIDGRDLFEQTILDLSKDIEKNYKKYTE